MEKMKPMRPVQLMTPLPQNTWWPKEWGNPTTSGSTEELRYAYFALRNRLAVDRKGLITVYDTAAHHFRGVLQSHGPNGKLSFADQYGRVNSEDLSEVGIIDNTI